MPELPEVDSARAVIARTVLHQRVVSVENVDTYVCRPHSAEEFQSVIVGRRIVSANRRGKLIWCDLSPLSGGQDVGPQLGLHLGMGGRIVVTDASGRVVPEGDSTHGLAGEHLQQRWDRFTVQFGSGLSLRLVDKRRFGRVRLNPPVDALGPDALDVGLVEFRRLLARGTTTIKARLLDQSVLAGIGNLLADELLWQSRISPAKRVDRLSPDEVRDLHRAMRRAVRQAIAAGGSHTGRVIAARHEGGVCPRCGAPMRHGTVGGRSTWWCEREQDDEHG
ncbi:MAG: formamidopyrimidine-DNA glycosylase [Pseudonocardiales bacterium]|nr:MAG: formamidopyrimidine-DNA glycosylase [Pseudonocardiales bacterium]